MVEEEQSAKEFFATWQVPTGADRAWRLLWVLGFCMFVSLASVPTASPTGGSLIPEKCLSRESTFLACAPYKRSQDKPRSHLSPRLVIPMLLTLVPGLFLHPCDLLLQLKVCPS